MRAFTIPISILLGVSLVAACGGGTKNDPPPTTPKETPVASASASVDPKKPDEPTIASKKGPLGFPLPADAEDAGAAPGGGGKILVYKVPRGVDAVAAEFKTLAQKEGWSLASEEKSPKGAIRAQWTKDGTTVKSSVLGDGTQTGIILTIP